MDGLPAGLVDLLEAQIEASEELPYDLLGVKRPKLSQIYVSQSVRSRAVDRKDTEAHPDGHVEGTVERTMTVVEALNANQHLVITGEPGAGKSTVGHVFVKSLCQHWLHDARSPLREPVVPVRVSARALVTPEAWSTALADGAREALGSMLNAAPDPALFSSRVQDARWMVFIDGLDELADETTKQIVRTIVRKARRGTDYRLVVTTRRLGDDLMKQLEEADIAGFTLQSFGQEQLDEFADHWFRAQDPVTAPKRAREFLQQTADGQLRELVRNPLLATIAAITATRKPDRPLPANRVDLYSGFMASLLEGQVSGRNVIAELRRTLAGRPGRLRLAEWMAEHRTTLIRHLAVQRLETEVSLLTAAENWVEAGHAELPEGWREDLRTVLVDSGVFVGHHTELRFLHQSFAEFLAAKKYAEELPADIVDLDRWVERGERSAERVLVLFTLVLWSRRPGHDAEVVVRQLLDRGAIWLAGQLLAEGCAVADDLVDEVVNRIVNLIVVGEGQLGELLGSIGSRVVGELHELVDLDELPTATRVECAIALGRLTEPEHAARKLEALGVRPQPGVLSRLVRGLVELVPDGAVRAERLLVALVNQVPRIQVLFEVVEALLELGRTEPAAIALRALAADARSDSPVERRWWDGTGDTAEFARLAVRCGCQDEAVWAARHTLTVAQGGAQDVASAAVVLLAVLGDSASDEVLDALAGRPAAHRALVVSGVSDAHPGVALPIARSVFEDRSVSLSQVISVAGVLVPIDGLEVLTEVEGRLDGHPSALGEHWADLAQVAMDGGHRPAALKFARRALGDLTSDRWDFAAAALLLLDLGAGVEEIRLATRSRPPEHRVKTIQDLCVVGKSALAADVVLDLLDSDVGEVGELLDLVPALASAGDQVTADRVVATATPLVDWSSESDLRSLSGALVAVRRPGEALDVARAALFAEFHSRAPQSGYVGHWLSAGGASSANDIVATVLPSVASARMRAAVAEALAGHGFLAQAVVLWLDVLTFERSSSEDRIAAAAKLVECGRRAEVIGVLRGSTRPELRALLGWVFLSVPGADPAELLKLLR